MVHFQEIFKIVKKWLVVPLLIIMGWQQWSTFLNHEKKFLNPVLYVKENYGNDYITRYGKRYDEIKNIFTTATHITYVGEANEEYNTGAMHYYLTQYFLTPNVLLQDNINRDTILYNLYWSAHINPETNFHLNNGWHVVRDFNNGLILLSK